LVGQIENLTRIVMQLSNNVTELSERIETVAGLLTKKRGRDGDTEGCTAATITAGPKYEWQYLSDSNVWGVAGNMDSITGTHSQGPNQ
jgi:hypothetical protein